jgi:hypothetical protein
LNNTVDEELKTGNKEKVLTEDIAVVVQREDMSRRMVVVMLLSDGQTELRDQLLPTTMDLVTKMPEYQIMFHSFGFTTNHDYETLHSLTTAGSCGIGMYYTFQSESDIPAAVGDCLGAVSKASVHGVTLRASVVTPDGISHVTPFFNGSSASTDATETNFEEKLGALSSDEEHTLVVICDKRFTYPAKLQIVVQYTDLQANTVVKDTVECPFPKFDNENQDIPAQNHVKTHIMRLTVGEALLRLVDPASLSNSHISTLEEMHASLLNELEQIQKCEGALSLNDESVMISLEQDLGEALERISQSSAGIINTNLRGRFLQFAHEHLHQRSASTKSLVRATYATKEQLAMRVRFLAASDPTFVAKATVAAEKASLPIREAGITDEQAAKRKFADQELTCYVSLSSWREEEMGIGLLVKPRTMRERYKKLMPMISIVPDYMSAAAFNAGVKTTVEKGATLDREDEEAREEHSIIKSSSRGRINAWLPLYINATHWKSAKQYAPSALSIIATQYNDMFKPIYALKVCSKLMIANVVKFTIEDQHASERAIQMYCDIHRLFYEMTKEYPDIIKEAESAIEQFINNPKKRSRTYTPDLGDLILYLTVTPRFTWTDLKKAYIMESCRRSARFVRSIAGHVPLQSIKSEDELFEYWMKGTNGGRVTMFNVLFINLIARPPGSTLEDIANTYDSRWGRLSDEKLSALKRGYDEIMKVTRLHEVLAKLDVLLPNDAIAELLLWAFECKEEVDVKWQEFPMTGGSRVEEWKERSKLYQLVKDGPCPPSIPPFRQKKQKPTWYPILGKYGVASFLSSVDLNATPSIAHNQDCMCDNCIANIKRLQRVEAWKSSIAHHGVGEKDNEPLELHPLLQVFIGRLPKKETSDNIQAAIKQAIPAATRVIVVLDTAQKPKGYAFVEFAAEDALREVLQNKTLNILNKEVIVDTVKGYGRDIEFLPAYLRPSSLEYVVE